MAEVPRIPEEVRERVEELRTRVRARVEEVRGRLAEWFPALAPPEGGKGEVLPLVERLRKRAEEIRARWLPPRLPRGTPYLREGKEERTAGEEKPRYYLRR